MFQNATLSQLPIQKMKVRDDLLAWCRVSNMRLSKRELEVRRVVDSFNKTQDGILRIHYNQSGHKGIDLDFEDLFEHEKSKWFRKYNITKENIIEFLYALNARIGLIDMSIQFLSKQYTQLSEVLSISDFTTSVTPEMVNEGVKRLSKDNITNFFDILKKAIFSQANKSIWVYAINRWIDTSEEFGLEFNINNKEVNTNIKPLYKSVGELSLGQTVVAMLSFILSYSEYSNDFTPLIIDQPEDNLDNQYIHKNLVADLRKVRSKRQVIIATHNSTIVTNAKAEQVIVMDSDNEHGWIDCAGYPTEPQIVGHIVNHLEGGIDSFIHKSFVYNGILGK
jgi:DNA repair exonuclease SbcCD ATPase subunit